MTKHLTIALATVLLLLASCKKEQPVERGTFSGAIEKQEAGGSKTHFVPGGTNQLDVVWDENDAVTLFSNNDTNGKEYALIDGAGTGSGQFSGDPIDATANQYVCFYPAGSAQYVSSSKGMTFSCTLPGTQTYVKESDGYFSKGTNLAVSYSTTAPSRTNPAKFKNLLGGLCLSLYSDGQGTVDKIVLIDKTSGAKLHGTATFDASSDNPSLTVSTPGESPNTITLNCGGVELGDAEHPTKFYFLLPEGALADGFTVDVYQTGITNPVTTMTTTSGAAEITRSSIKAVPKHEVEYEFVHVPIEGELTGGEFTVDGGGTKVHFSKSNLRWENGSFMFTNNQYDMLGKANQMDGDGPIDLFGWGTSGVNYDPYLTSDNEGDYPTSNLTGDDGYVNDWGSQPIVNGGNKANCWRTLTNSELNYVLNTRPYGRRWSKAQVCGVDGLVIVPDNFPEVFPEGAKTIDGYTGMNWQILSWYHIIRFDDYNWGILQSYGCVFLPAAYWRTGSGSDDFIMTSGVSPNVSTLGCYFTSEIMNGYAGVLQFRGDGASDCNPVIQGCYKHWGSSVRLVRNCTKPSGK